MAVDSLEKNNERPRMINHRYKAKCKSLGVPLAEYKETLISYTRGQRKTKDQAQHLIIRGTGLQRRWNSQLQPICYAKVRGLAGKTGALRLSFGCSQNTSLTPGHGQGDT